MKVLAEARGSGKTDELPKNRFSRKPMGGYLVIGVVAALLLAYFGFRFYKISGTPVIMLTYPSENMTVVYGNYISIYGKVSNSDEFAVNGKQIQPQPDGKWEETVMLDPGINSVEITAKKFLGRESKIDLQIVYVQSTSTPENKNF